MHEFIDVIFRYIFQMFSYPFTRGVTFIVQENELGDVGSNPGQLGISVNTTILPPNKIVGQIGIFFNLNTATSLGEGKY